MSDDQPSLWLLAGPNGSGKSTFYHQKLSALIPTYVNPDEIAKKLTSVDPQQRDLKAMELAEQQRHNLITAGETFVAETVFSHPSKLDLIREAKAALYKVTLVFICTNDPLINLARVQDRVALGGHDVPADKIAPRYERSLQNLRQAVLLADRTLLYDNSNPKEFHHLTVEISQGVAKQYDAQLPDWVAKAFPEGIQPYLDTHRDKPKP